MLTLGEKQRLFARLLGEFLVWLYANGYEITFSDVSRTDEQAEINALGSLGRNTLVAYLRNFGTSMFLRLADCIANNTGSGIRNSLHELRLAADLNLFIAGSYIADPTKYKVLGEKWESMHSLCTWGGRFNDANHFSITHEGRK